MSSLLQVDRVQYLIDEDRDESEPLARLYFCIYCMALRSADDLQFEIDSHFCPQTLDGLPSGDAAMKKNKSANSWQCPFCAHTLTPRATNSSVPSTDDPSKTVTKKFYFQVCTFCKWSSRSVGMPDKEIVSGAWSEMENPNQSRIQNLLEYYKCMSMKEMAEMDQKKSTKKRGYFTLAMQLQQKYGGPRSSRSKKIPPSLASSLSGLRLKDTIKEVTIEPSQTLGLDEIERLPEDIYTKPVEFTKVSSIAQRHDQPGYQTDTVASFWPRRSTMFIKRSLRCMGCDHNIIKPEYNSSSIKFKINLMAIEHVPEVRIHEPVVLEAGRRTRVILSFINRTERVINVNFLPHGEENEKKRSNAQVDLPQSGLVLANYDETAEFGSVTGSADDIGTDDPDVIAFRSANKVGFYVHCTPDKHLSPNDDVWITFSFKHDGCESKPNSQILKGTESEKHEVLWLTQTVYINLGKITLGKESTTRR